jgi:hypothetical protein
MMPDDADTEPLVAADRAIVASQSSLVGPGESAELVLDPDEPMVRPVLFLSSSLRSANVVVEHVMHDAHVVRDTEPLDGYKFGAPLKLTASRAVPVRVLVRNCGAETVKVGASLVARG